MVRKIKTIILILILGQTSLVAQSLLDSFPYTFVDTQLIDLQVDKLNNTWYFYSNRIVRHSQDKAYIDTMNISNYENGWSIDIKFPLKVLLYNQNTNTIEIFNSRWGSMTKFKLDRVHIYQPSVVSFALDKTIWALDINDNKLYKVNETGVKVYERKNPFAIGNQFYFPTQIFEFENYTVGFDTSFGLIVLDLYGNLVQTIALDKVQKIFLLNNSLYILKENDLSCIRLNPEINKFQVLSKIISLPPIISLSQSNENTLILAKDKKLYSVKNLDLLFK